MKISANSVLGGKTTIGETSMPITKAGDTSGATTTFTATTVVDATAWDLSAVAAGMYAVTSDGYVGLISVVNDGTDTVTVKAWVKMSNGIVGTPTATSTVTVHKVYQCTQMVIVADTSNGSTIHVQRNGDDATTNDYVLNADERLVIKPVVGSKYVNVTKINGISASGNLVLWFMTDAE